MSSTQDFRMHQRMKSLKKMEKQITHFEDRIEKMQQWISEHPDKEPDLSKAIEDGKTTEARFRYYNDALQKMIDSR